MTESGNKLVKLFVSKSEETNLTALDNGKDLVVYPQIPTAKADKYRGSFLIGKDETILYIRDTSFWNNANEGTVITDLGITVIPDNNAPGDVRYYKWEDISHVEYKEQTLLIYKTESEDPMPIPLKSLIKSRQDNEYSIIGNKFVDIFNAMAEAVEQMNCQLFE